MSLNYFYQIALLAVLIYIPAEGSKILAISNVPAFSHSLWYIKLVKLLAHHGHQIVFLDVEPKKFDHENVTHYYLPKAHENFHAFMASVESGAISMESVVEDHSVLAGIYFLTSPEVLACRKMMISNEFNQFLKYYKGYDFDLIIFDIGCEAFYGLVPYFGNVPFIMASAYSEPFTTLELAFSVYDNPSYVPSPFTFYQREMTFRERIENCFYKLYYYYRLYHLFEDQQILVEEIFGKSVGNLADIISNTALMFYTYHPALFGAKPLPPSVIPVAGFHIDPPKPLPKEIKQFMDEAKEGVVYFSMGSSIKSIVMSKKNIKMFLDVFREIPQRVIWKLEIDDKTNIPPNVMISKWLPQNDILGHPNVRCFISHGGLSGMQEGIYHGVPILGLPILFDQLQTINRLVKDGVAMDLEYSKLSKTYFKKKLNAILSDESISARMKEKSQVFRDAPDTPRERVMFWINHTLKNPSARLDYLKSSSSKLTWYQRTLLDIAALFLLVVSIIAFSLLKIIAFINKLICSSKRKVKFE